MYLDRQTLYRELEKERGSTVIAYITGDRPNLQTMISSEVLDFFVAHLDRINMVPNPVVDAIGLAPPRRITLYLYTQGGETLAAWSIANLLRSFCDELEIVIPSRAHSAGTLISLACQKIVMTKQATLGPIDPSVTGPLNPPIPGAPPSSVAPVSVEDVNAFLDFGRRFLGEQDSLGEVFSQLANSVHPLVLGNAYRARSQIRMLARKLLETHMGNEATIGDVMDFLCGESGSHDYTINRQEAERLGLPIEVPSWRLYSVIKSIYDDIFAELELRTPFVPAIALGQSDHMAYELHRGLLESVEGGSHVFVSEGVLSRHRVEAPDGVDRDAVADNRHFEGWRHER